MREEISDVKTLRQLKKGQHAHVIRFFGVTSDCLHKMMALGLIPGEEIEVLQTFPTYVLRLGYTQLAVDRTLARGVEVETR